jgi:PKD repeat protein
LGRWSLGIAALAAIAFLQAAKPPIGLTATPNPATAGQPVTFTATLSAGAAASGQLSIDFGDGSKPAPAQPNAAVMHAYANPGKYTAQLFAAGVNQHAVASVVVTVNAAPNGLSVQAIALAWPDGSTSLTLSGARPPPQPLAILQTSGSGSLMVEWMLDGTPFMGTWTLVSTGGNQRLALTTQLPITGSHSIGLLVLQPEIPLGAKPTPPPAITYAYASAPTPTPAPSATASAKPR